MAPSVSDSLLAWYDTHHRTLPWRAAPGEPATDPYRVWLSEIMLQQTTVAAVKPYFEAFTARWPTVDALAAAPEEDVMAAWAGLGYYSRARNLVKTAALVAERGAFPDTEAALRELPGLGAYTAAAIAAIAFGRRAVVVDANVERVVSRLFAIEEPLPKSRKTIRERTETITPQARAGDFAQAMMDLGSGICTTRNPKCLLCPLRDSCEARASDEPERFPVKSAKKDKPVRRGVAYWIKRDSSAWLVTRPTKGVFAGMRALPSDGWSARADGSGDEPLSGVWRSIGGVQHGFTHFALQLDVKRYEGTEMPEGDGEWWPVDRLAEAGLPTLFAKAARLALAEPD
ncbi:A/G-specific adenine glycosylase [Erythrobacter litoralis]|uniref:A/G-specific adenine glycosylase n=1 Tax=Erythrobacter litoralis TaxID=39960 RepID=UPI002434EDFD|nr:A/G-specific adenine glycosylase [Erythrobacter litoralis]MDG6078565.1 A/G-specific adenine glycosylase [Erythrobacter litoralis]